MKVSIEVPEYSRETGIHIGWENNFTIAVRVEGNSVVIEANKQGLISLAQHLLTLAQDQIPTGHHIHYDEFNSLEDGSNELIVEKL